jgi:hypothetical protein
MAVTNAEAIRFVNEVVRPLCEELRAFKVRASAAATLWYAGMNTTIPNSAAQDIADGREAEGVSRLDGADVHNAMAQILGVSPNAEIVQLPCVRQLP